MESWDGWPSARLYMLFNTYCQFPVNFAQALVNSNPDLWGQELMDVLDEYAHWGLVATLGEVLPTSENRVTLADEVDDNGIPVARITFAYGENDKAIIEAERQLGERVMETAGATRLLTSDGTHPSSAPPAWAPTRRRRSSSPIAARTTFPTSGSATARCGRRPARSTPA